jgi:hypothetical protein
MTTKRTPCFILDLNAPKNLLDAALKANASIPLIIISHKNFEDDHKRILQGIEDTLIKNNLHISQRIIYDGGRFLSTILIHGPSQEQYEFRMQIINDDLFPSEHSPITFAKVQSLLKILGIKTTDESSYSINLETRKNAAYEISFSDVVAFKKCVICFLITKKYRQKRDYNEGGFPIQNATDEILKDELKKCRDSERPHPLMIKANIDAVPFCHKDISTWTDSNYGRGGIQIYDHNRNLIIKGVPDDIWRTNQGRLIVADIKTVKGSIDTEEAIRQLSWYGCIFEALGFPVYENGYLLVNRPDIKKYSITDIIFAKVPQNEFIFNPYADQKDYKRQLAFEPELRSVRLDYSWIGPVLDDMVKCLQQDEAANFYKEAMRQKCFACDSHDIRDSIINKPAQVIDHAQTKLNIGLIDGEPSF